MDKGTYSVKNVKSFKGRENVGGYTCSVYNGKAKILIATDSDNGGPVHLAYIDGWKDNPERIAIEAHAKSVLDMEFEVVEGFINRLVDEVLHKRWLKSNCRTKTMFRMAGDPEGEYRTVKSVYSEAVKDFIIGQYGKDIVALYDNKGELVEINC